MSDSKQYQSYLDSLYESCIDYPATVSIETFVQCNAACDFCPYPQLTRQGELMSDDLIEKIITDLMDIPRSHGFEVNLSRVNEPFLDNRIFDIAGRINESLPQASLIFFTNGTPLNRQNVQKLKALRSVSRLNISLNEHTAEKYQEVMQLPFERTMEVLRALHDTDLPFPIVASRVGDGSEKDQSFLKWVGQVFPKFTAVVSPRSGWLGLKPNGQLQDAIPDVGCAQWFKLHFLADGREAFCCIDAEGKWGKGNVRTMHALDIYDAAERRSIRLSRISRLHGGSLCSACTLLS